MEAFYYFKAHLFNFGFLQFLQCKFNLVSFSLCLLFFLKKRKIFGILLVRKGQQFMFTWKESLLVIYIQNIRLVMGNFLVTGNPQLFLSSSNQSFDLQVQHFLLLPSHTILFFYCYSNAWKWDSSMFLYGLQLIQNRRQRKILPQWNIAVDAATWKKTCLSIELRGLEF